MESRKSDSRRRFDPLTRAQRSYTMSRVRGKDTSAEMAVRRVVHRMGYRYSLRRTDLPGKPDLAFVSRRKLIFVHGCFWHGHSCKSGRKRPKSNEAYWLPKLRRNRARDTVNQAKLRDLGWNVLILWECQLSDEAALRRQLNRFLGRRVHIPGESGH